MTDLSPNARALIRNARSGLRPSDGDRARIDSALRERLGADALASVTMDKPAATALVSWPMAAAVGLGVCIVGALALMWFRTPENSSPPQPPPPATSTQPTPATQTPPSDVTPAASLPPPPPPPTEHAAPVPPTRDRLAREVALLSRATSALHARDAAAALKALDEHQRLFPNGVLTQERRAAKAQALCSLGRMREGRAELARLTPRSPEAARAQELCRPPPTAAGP